jgi:hypothetical protein
MNGKGSWPRPRFVSRSDYGDNYDRIFGKTKDKVEPEPETKGETMDSHPATTVGQLKKMLADLPDRLDEAAVLVHIAAEKGWATGPIKPMVGRTSSDTFVLLSTELPDELEEYAEEGDEVPPLHVVK